METLPPAPVGASAPVPYLEMFMGYFLYIGILVILLLLAVPAISRLFRHIIKSKNFSENKVKTLQGATSFTFILWLPIVLGANIMFQTSFYEYIIIAILVCLTLISLVIFYFFCFKLRYLSTFGFIVLFAVAFFLTYIGSTTIFGTSSYERVDIVLVYLGSAIFIPIFTIIMFLSKFLKSKLSKGSITS